MTKENVKHTPDINSATGDESVTVTSAQDAKVESAPEAPSTNNEMSLANLRLNQNFIETAGTKKLRTTVPVRKPGPQDFIRVHPDSAFRYVVALLELKDDRDVYLLTPAMAEALPGEFFMATLFTVINRQNVISLWPVRLPAKDGKHLTWHRSAAAAAELAMTKWLRVKANMSLGAYEITLATTAHDDPAWDADLNFQNLIDVAFRDYFINRIDHPVVQRLRGQV
jgi:hypothetical protein